MVFEKSLPSFFSFCAGVNSPFSHRTRKMAPFLFVFIELGTVTTCLSPFWNNFKEHFSRYNLIIIPYYIWNKSDNFLRRSESIDQLGLGNESQIIWIQLRTPLNFHSNQSFSVFFNLTSEHFFEKNKNDRNINLN